MSIPVCENKNEENTTCKSNLFSDFIQTGDTGIYHFMKKNYHLLSPVSLKYLDNTDGKRNGRYSFFLCCHVTYSSPICLSQFLLNKLNFIFDSHNLISLWHSLLGSSKHNVTFMTCIAKWNQNTIMPMSFNLLNNIKNVSNLVIHRSENIA